MMPAAELCLSADICTRHVCVMTCEPSAAVAQGPDTKLKQMALAIQLNSIRTSVHMMQKGAYTRLKR